MSAFRVYKHYFLATGDAVDADATGYAGISPSVNADAPKKMRQCWIALPHYH